MARPGAYKFDLDESYLQSAVFKRSGFVACLHPSARRYLIQSDSSKSPPLQYYKDDYIAAKDFLIYFLLKEIKTTATECGSKSFSRVFAPACYHSIDLNSRAFDNAADLVRSHSPDPGANLHRPALQNIVAYQLHVQ
jgi:hypothetical protein